MKDIQELDNTQTGINHSDKHTDITGQTFRTRHDKHGMRRMNDWRQKHTGIYVDGHG